jgi:hypothetical protein
MKLITTAVALTMLALPASAAAAGTHGVVLSVNARHHTIEVVDTGHVVHGYKYRGRLPKLHAGTTISFRRSGKAISRVTVSAASTQHSRRVSFYARVVRSSHKGLVLALADGQRMTLSAGQIGHKRLRTKHHSLRAHAAVGARAAAGSITVNVLGLSAGVTVLVTETVGSHGDITITITLPSPSAPGSPVGSEQQSAGVVDVVNPDSFVVDTSDGSPLVLNMAADALSNLGLSTCDIVTVSYHQDAAMLIADHVQVTGASSSGSCGSSGEDQDQIGTITSVSGTGITVATQDNGPMTFTVDSSDVTAGYAVGDVVDVTYSQTSAGSLNAWDVEYVQQDAAGVVTAVSAGSVTLTDDTTGLPTTFTAAPSDGLFDGVAVGDQVDVTYHQSGSQLVVDQVDDSGAP